MRGDRECGSRDRRDRQGRCWREWTELLGRDGHLLGRIPFDRDPEGPANREVSVERLRCRRARPQIVEPTENTVAVLGQQLKVPGRTDRRVGRDALRQALNGQVQEGALLRRRVDEGPRPLGPDRRRWRRAAWATGRAARQPRR